MEISPSPDQHEKQLSLMDYQTILKSDIWMMKMIPDKKSKDQFIEHH